MSFTIRYTVEIERPIELVFDFHANLLNHVDWHDHILTVDLISEKQSGLGASYRVTNKVGWFVSTDKREIIDYDPPHRYTYQLTTSKLIGTSQQILEAQGNHTNFTVLGEFQGIGFGRLLEPMIFPRLNAHMGEAVLELKTYIEANL